MENNFRYTKTLAEWATARGVRFLYASSGQTYGDGELGFADDDAVAPYLRPITRYGYSKHFFDLHALRTRLTEEIVGENLFLHFCLTQKLFYNQQKIENPCWETVPRLKFPIG